MTSHLTIRCIGLHIAVGERKVLGMQTIFAQILFTVLPKFCQKSITFTSGYQIKNTQSCTYNSLL